MEQNLNNSTLPQHDAKLPVSRSFINARAICEDCGTTKENDVTGYCINDHDNWIEESESERIIKAAKKFRVDPDVVIYAIRKSKDLFVHE